jgi:uncharacterized protein YjaG (DUF416 family)
VSDLKFNETQLVRHVERLSPRLRVAFAAASAERLLPAYVHFAQQTGRADAAVLAELLDRLWQDLQGDRMSAQEVQDRLNRCMALIPDEDEDEDQSSEEYVAAMEAQADHAASALAYAYRCRQNEAAQEAAWAARRAYEAVDHWVINRDDIDISKRGAEQRVLSHPLVQAELARQRRDLEELLAIRDEGAVANALAQLRSRAQAEASSVFG